MTGSKKLILLVTILSLLLTTSWAMGAPIKKQQPVTKNKHNIAVNSQIKVGLNNLDKNSKIIGYKVSGRILVPTKQVVEFVIVKGVSQLWPVVKRLSSIMDIR